MSDASKSLDEARKVRVALETYRGCSINHGEWVSLQATQAIRLGATVQKIAGSTRFVFPDGSFFTIATIN